MKKSIGSKKPGVFGFLKGTQTQGFFQNFASSCRRGNRVDKLRDEDGFGPTDMCKFDPKVTVDDNVDLMRPITDYEVKNAVFSTHDDKFPGPDALILIPKVTNSEYITNLRPISLCNVSNKIISKVMANRMKGYSSLGNCDMANPILPSKGLRPGDPLSPYLFIICAEGLSLLLNGGEEEGNIHGMSERVPISSELGVKESLDSGKYIGLPSLVGRNKSPIFSFLRERVWSKVKGWNSKKLSRGGKEILIKAVAQTMPNYVMNVFLIPLRLCEEERKGISWDSWDRLCIPKKFGGMRFKKIQDFNIAMLVRQAWRFITVENNLMVKVFKAKYFPNSTFLEAKLGSNPSYVWRSIFESQAAMVKGSRVRIDNGRKTSIWNSPWVLPDNSGHITTPMPISLSKAKVCDLFEIGESCWDTGLIMDVFNKEDVENILSIPLNSRNVDDGWL
ncbi:uncharacterized protein LOC126672583 [Mercurialis annua]|uniref:uncharacterized protein LOC126672583 n=1 Tax=Mercurialis annua TaxID=3986 RepID=UPI00215F29AE|nr:uncharacterized protein LOC126672583 [Mercurialis annua]